MKSLESKMEVLILSTDLAIVKQAFETAKQFRNQMWPGFMVPENNIIKQFDFIIKDLNQVLNQVGFKRNYIYLSTILSFSTSFSILYQSLLKCYPNCDIELLSFLHRQELVFKAWYEDVLNAES